MQHPTIEKSDIFQRNTFGYYHFRIPALAITAKGTLLAACEARKWPNDWATQAIMLRRSLDNGKTWEPMRPLAEVKWNQSIFDRFSFLFKKRKQVIVNNPLFIIDQDGIKIHFLSVATYKQCFYRQSQDEGLTWSDPVDITPIFEHYRLQYNLNVIAVGPGKGIQIKGGKYRGRLIAPIWLAYGKVRSHRPSIAGTIYSDDQGNTWHPGDLVSIDANMLNFSESYAIELEDGRILLNIRNESHKITQERFRLTSVSDDGAHNWSMPTFDRGLYEPVCMASMVRYHMKGAAGIPQPCILFSNPCSEHPGKRENLTIKISKDEHKSWDKLCVLEQAPSAYSDLAIAPDNSIFCLYERSEKNSLFPYDNICIAHIFGL